MLSYQARPAQIRTERFYITSAGYYPLKSGVVVPGSIRHRDVVELPTSTTAKNYEPKVGGSWSNTDDGVPTFLEGDALGAGVTIAGGDADNPTKYNDLAIEVTSFESPKEVEYQYYYNQIIGMSIPDNMLRLRSEGVAVPGKHNVTPEKTIPNKYFGTKVLVDQSAGWSPHYVNNEYGDSVYDGDRIRWDVLYGDENGILMHDDDTNAVNQITPGSDGYVAPGAVAEIRNPGGVNPTLNQMLLRVTVIGERDDDEDESSGRGLIRIEGSPDLPTPI